MSLDVSQESDQREILRILEDDGWVILKGVTDLNSIERARLHEVKVLLLLKATHAILTQYSMFLHSLLWQEAASLNKAHHDAGLIHISLMYRLYVHQTGKISPKRKNY